MASVHEGTKVWVKVEDEKVAWVVAEITEVMAGGKCKVKLDNGEERTAVTADLPLQNEGPDVDDMCTLNYLHAPAILHNVQMRFEKNEVYTFTGRILIAVNPFKWLPLYGNDMVELYRGRELGDCKPHVFANTDLAFRQMTKDRKSQSILVSGESGAGKTETTKLCMQYLASISGSGQGPNRVAQQVLESNPILEAFGNAKTLRNDNSSRFGKFIEIQFDKDWKVAGASIQTYLLEKSRVIAQAQGERNYHIFYQLCAGASDEERAKLHLRKPEEFVYLKGSGCVSIPGLSEADEFAKTRRAMGVVGITEEEQMEALRVVATVLNLGEVTFKPDPAKEDAVVVDDGAALKRVAELLGCTEEELTTVFCSRRIFAGGEWYTIEHTMDQAVEARDALAKALYGRLFEWLVQRINKCIRNDEKTVAFIGILDIFGFESFKVNSFEQLCINFANEKLQQQFNQHVFKMEQEEYSREKIDWAFIEFVDNQDCLDMLEKRPMGVFCLLDEECVFPKASDRTFAAKVQKTHQGNRYFDKPRMSSTAFTVKHYAGDVIYETAGFLEKNKDSLHPDTIKLMQQLQWQFVAGLFPAAEFPTDVANTKRSILYMTVGSQFKEQLNSLMQRIGATALHYIRCIKPNTVNTAEVFEQRFVASQLAYSGVLEAVRVSRAAYPNRLPHVDFLRRFKVLAGLKDSEKSAQEVKAACESLLSRLALEKDRYQIGLSKVFFRQGVLEHLEQMRNEKQSVLAVVIQRVARMHLARGRFLRAREAARKMQAATRRHLARAKFQRIHRACVAIQAVFRGCMARRRYADRLRHHKATLIQKAVRSYLRRKVYNTTRAAAAKIQAVVRGRQQKARYLREVTVVRRKAQLEHKVEDLEAELKAEKEARAAADAAAEQLRAELDAARKEAEAARAALEESKESTAKAAASGEAAAAELRKQVEAAQAAAAELQKQLDAAKASAASTEKELAGARTARVADETATASRLLSLETEVEELKEQYDEAMKMADEASAKRDEAERRGAVAEADLITATKARDALQAEVQALRAQLAARPAAGGAAAAPGRESGGGAGGFPPMPMPGGLPLTTPRGQNLTEEGMQLRQVIREIAEARKSAEDESKALRKQTETLKSRIKDLEAELDRRPPDRAALLKAVAETAGKKGENGAEESEWVDTVANAEEEDEQAAWSRIMKGQGAHLSLDATVDRLTREKMSLKEELDETREEHARISTELQKAKEQFRETRSIADTASEKAALWQTKYSEIRQALAAVRPDLVRDYDPAPETSRRSVADWAFAKFFSTRYGDDTQR
eukprot:tig00021108_g18313.t1